MRISDEQVAAAYSVAKQVYEKRLKATQGVETLSTLHGLNPATANDFINDYKYLLEGRVFQRAMSAPAMRYFLEQIFAQYEEATKRNALVSLRKHIAYYEGHYKRRIHKMRSVADDFEMMLQVPTTAEEIYAALSRAVEQSLRRPPNELRQLLAGAATVPRSVIVQTKVFMRNPHVVAAALMRANGACESCDKAAPFRKATDGSPYLEVHHRIPLAKGGEDTLENAIALCPNCHRREHHGEKHA